MKPITLEQAMNVVKEKEAFYFKDEEYNGNTFRIFNYRLSSYSDFLVEGAIELRGLAFNLDTGEVWLGLHKFFNNQENPFSMGEELWDGKLEVREKLDGSLILPIIIKDEVVFRTKGTFVSEQTRELNLFLKKKNEEERNSILCTIKNLLKEYYLYFEFISPFNQVVIPYEKTDLRLLQVRRKDGSYLTYSEMKELVKGTVFENKVVSVEYTTLDDLMERRENLTGVEGWVVMNPKEPLIRQFRKIKTKYYLALHHLLTPDNLVENKLIEHVLNETIDDVIANIINPEKREKLEYIRCLVSHHFDKTVKELEKLFDEKEQMERKEFALKYKNYEYFGVLMTSRTKEDLPKKLKEIILKWTLRLGKAREFLKQIEKDTKCVE